MWKGVLDSWNTFNLSIACVFYNILQRNPVRPSFNIAISHHLDDFLQLISIFLSESCNILIEDIVVDD